jgi:hypothetical protein
MKENSKYLLLIISVFILLTRCVTPVKSETFLLHDYANIYNTDMIQIMSKNSYRFRNILLKEPSRVVLEEYSEYGPVYIVFEIFRGRNAVVLFYFKDIQPGNIQVCKENLKEIISRKYGNPVDTSSQGYKWKKNYTSADLFIRNETVIVSYFFASDDIIKIISNRYWS